MRRLSGLFAATLAAVGYASGSPYGWLQIPATNKAMQAYVTGLWLSGNAPDTFVYIYTNAPAAAGGYCQVTQINPQS